MGQHRHGSQRVREALALITILAATLTGAHEASAQTADGELVAAGMSRFAGEARVEPRPPFSAGHLLSTDLVGLLPVDRCHYTLEDPCSDEINPRSELRAQIRHAMSMFLQNRGSGRASVATAAQNAPAWTGRPRFSALRLLAGIALLGGGSVLSTTKNDWVVDEGYIGMGIATTGLVMVVKQLVP